MIEIRQLRYFVAAADDLHFARAADRLDVAQSAVSSQIQRLEQDIGTRLLNRNKRQPITLTEAGKLFYVEAVAALLHIERAERIGKLAACGMAGLVHMGYVASGVTTGLLSRMLGGFRSSHPEVRMNVVAMETPKQLEAIANGELDVGIVRVRRQYPVGVKATVIHSERLMVAMQLEHPLSGKTAVKAADLRDQSFISPQFNESEGFSENLGRLGATGGFTITSEYRVNDFIAAVSLAASGYGVVIVPESIRLFEQPGVAFRPISDFTERVHLALAHRKKENSAAVRSFVEAALKLAPSQV